MTDLRLLHNELAGEIVKSIVKPMIDAGGTMEDALILLESVSAGVLSAYLRLGGNEAVIDVFTEGVKARLAGVQAKMEQANHDSRR